MKLTQIAKTLLIGATLAFAACGSPKTSTPTPDLGRFETELEAATAYTRAARKYFEEFAAPNMLSLEQNMRLAALQNERAAALETVLHIRNEKDRALVAVTLTNGNKTEAARILGWSRSGMRCVLGEYKTRAA